jgi:RNA polymerase sigma-70 factor (ECF subfamily)
MDAETAWKNHSAEIRRFIASRIQDEPAIGDVLHDVYLKTTERFDQLRDQGRYVSWALKIAQNVTMDHYRRQRDSGELIKEPEAPDSCDGSEEWTKASACVKPFIEELPRGYREALMLSAIEGYDDKEVARRMGLSLPATKSRIARGKKMLKEKFDTCDIFNINARQAIIESDTFGKVVDDDPELEEPGSDSRSEP